MANRELYFVRIAKAFVDKQGISRKRIIFVAILVGLLIAFLFVFAGPYGVINMMKINKEKKVLLGKIQALEAERNTLKQAIIRLQTDNKEIERIAREQYGMAKPGERVYKIVPADTSAAGNKDKTE
ncbi:MAG: septum formation initiator family protein [Fibrobacteres bacterium]|nr:septum formation initiator family protein [Fibrobacterota bacterium]